MDGSPILLLLPYLLTAIVIGVPIWIVWRLIRVHDERGRSASRPASRGQD